LILIVDDEEQIREILKIKMQASGFDVAEAADGESAVSLARELKPDIFILDVVMPKMDGVEALFKIKTDPTIRNTKVFLFTGKGDPREKVVEVNKKFAQESGAVDFIRKEINLNELVEKLRKTYEEIKKEKILRGEIES